MGPDLGTDEQIMTWIKDQYMHTKGEEDINYAAAVTGKMVSQNGLPGRVESAGLGVFFGIEELLNIDSFVEKIGLEKGIAGKTFTIQGLG